MTNCQHCQSVTSISHPESAQTQTDHSYFRYWMSPNPRNIAVQINPKTWYSGQTPYISQHARKSQLQLAKLNLGLRPRHINRQISIELSRYTDFFTCCHSLTVLDSMFSSFERSIKQKILHAHFTVKDGKPSTLPISHQRERSHPNGQCIPISATLPNTMVHIPMYRMTTPENCAELIQVANSFSKCSALARFRNEITISFHFRSFSPSSTL